MESNVPCHHARREKEKGLDSRLRLVGIQDVSASHQAKNGLKGRYKCDDHSEHHKGNVQKISLKRGECCDRAGEDDMRSSVSNVVSRSRHYSMETSIGGTADVRRPKEDTPLRRRVGVNKGTSTRKRVPPETSTGKHPSPVVPLYKRPRRGNQPQRPVPGPGVYVQSLFLDEMRYDSVPKIEVGPAGSRHEPLPHVPPPWTRLNPPSLRNKKKIRRQREQQRLAINATKGEKGVARDDSELENEGLVVSCKDERRFLALPILEEGEIEEEVALTPHPLLPKVDHALPPWIQKTEELQSYIREVKSAYYDAKNSRRQWLIIRPAYQERGFQALTSDYLADCQMRRDRGQITDAEFESRSSRVLSLLFEQQLTAEARLDAAERNLRNLYDFLRRLAHPTGIGDSIYTGDDIVEHLQRIEVPVPLPAPTLKSVGETGIGSLSASAGPHGGESTPRCSRSGKYHREACYSDSTSSPTARDLSPEPVSNVWKEDHESRQKEDEEAQGVSLVRSFHDRLRIMRALDQKAPWSRRVFNGKLTTFNEARATGRHGDQAMDRYLLQSANPVIMHTPDFADRDASLAGSSPDLYTWGCGGIQLGRQPISLDIGLGAPCRPHVSNQSNRPFPDVNQHRPFISHCSRQEKLYIKHMSVTSQNASLGIEREASKCSALVATGLAPKQSFESPLHHCLFGSTPSAGRIKFADEEEPDE